MRQRLEGAGFKMENRVMILMEKEIHDPHGERVSSPIPLSKTAATKEPPQKEGVSTNQPRVQTLPVGFLLSLSSSASRAQSWFMWRCELGIAARCQDDALHAGN